MKHGMGELDNIDTHHISRKEYRKQRVVSSRRKGIIWEMETKLTFREIS